MLQQGNTAIDVFKGKSQWREEEEAEDLNEKEGKEDKKRGKEVLMYEHLNTGIGLTCKMVEMPCTKP
jgi:hypothetical protein